MIEGTELPFPLVICGGNDYAENAEQVGAFRKYLKWKEDDMAVSLFIGVMGGAILGFATQNGRSSLCTFIREKHPTLFKGIAITLLLGLILIPAAVVSGSLFINPTPFYWGGCMACSFVYSFFVVHCTLFQEKQDA